MASLTPELLNKLAEASTPEEVKAVLEIRRNSNINIENEIKEPQL